MEDGGASWSHYAGGPEYGDEWHLETYLEPKDIWPVVIGFLRPSILWAIVVSFLFPWKKGNEPEKL